MAMAKMKITPDAQLATTEAVQTRVDQLKKELEKTKNPSDVKQLNGRIRALQTRLGIGPAQKTVSNAALLISKNDLL